MRKAIVLAVLVHLVLAGGALGMLMDASGNVTDWGVTPFSLPNQSDTRTGSMWTTSSNNYSPINYPGGVGHQPSPGLPGAEPFDLEEIHMRLTDTQVQVLVVTSSAWSTPAAGTTWYLGDLFVTVGDQRYGIVTQSASQGLAAGAIYRVNGSANVVALQPGDRSYAGSTTLVANDYGPNDTVPNIAGPWAVAGTLGANPIGSAALDWATFDYGGAEQGTFLLEYTFDRDLLGIGTNVALTTKMTWGCGNDVIRVRGDTSQTPEPATLGLLVVGSLLTLLARRRRVAT